MKIKNQTFATRAGDIALELKEACIALLERAGGEQGIDQCESQIELAAKLSEEEGDEFTVTVEEAALLRQLLSRSNLIPVIRVPMYRAFDPPEPPASE